MYIQDVVHHNLPHISPVKERMSVKKKQPEVIMRCIGNRKEPSKEALDRFIETYVKMVKANQQKLRKVQDVQDNQDYH